MKRGINPDKFDLRSFARIMISSWLQADISLIWITRLIVVFLQESLTKYYVVVSSILRAVLSEVLDVEYYTKNDNSFLKNTAQTTHL